MFGDQQTNRRRVLKAVGGTGIGTLGLVGIGFSSASAGTVDGGAPAVEWRRSYEGGEREYENTLSKVLQTSDGGYALMGVGYPIAKTGPEEEQFSLIKTDSEGEKQWISFASDDNEETELEPVGFFQTEDGGHVIVGNVNWVYDEDHVDEDGKTSTEGKPLGVAAKFSPSGEVERFAVIEQGTDEPHQTGSLDAIAQSSVSDEFVAAGSWHDADARESSLWLVKFDPDGSVKWERTYDSWDRVNYVFARDRGGYTLIDRQRHSETRQPVFRVIRVAENGDVQDDTEIVLEYNNDHYVRSVIPTNDGGFALTGEVRAGDWDMWLAKLDENFDGQWYSTYDGPSEGSDGATELLQTDDGGYALGGHMAEAYTSEWRPAVVKTDAEGNEEWEKLLTEEDYSGVNGLVQTDEEGYAVALHKRLVKLGPGGGNQDDETTPSPIGDFENPPTDPDGDGKFEDVNGDGQFDIVDVQALFTNRTDRTIQNNPEKFDFNGDGEFDVVDVQALFTELTEEN